MGASLPVQTSEDNAMLTSALLETIEKLTASRDELAQVRAELAVLEEQACLLLDERGMYLPSGLLSGDAGTLEACARSEGSACGGSKAAERAGADEDTASSGHSSSTQPAGASPSTSSASPRVGAVYSPMAESLALNNASLALCSGA
eukprot:354866-Chlamydomonas_euryale.AAC.5